MDNNFINCFAKKYSEFLTSCGKTAPVKGSS